MRTEISSKLECSIKTIDSCLGGSQEFFVTTSFGYQSAMIFYILHALDYNIKALFVSSDLATGNINNHRDNLIARFNIDLLQIDRNPWLGSVLKGRCFFDLHPSERLKVCRGLKKPVVEKYSRDNAADFWITGIRKDQTRHRESISIVQNTDFGVVKLSPLANWSREDVDNAITYLNLPKNESYTDLCKFNQAAECGLHL